MIKWSDHIFQLDDSWRKTGESGTKCITFFYNTFGNGPGEMYVNVLDSKEDNNYPAWKSINTGGTWKEIFVEITPTGIFHVSIFQRCITLCATFNYRYYYWFAGFLCDPYYLTAPLVEVESQWTDTQVWNTEQNLYCNHNVNTKTAERQLTRR